MLIKMEIKAGIKMEIVKIKIRILHQEPPNPLMTTDIAGSMQSGKKTPPSAPLPGAAKGRTYIELHNEPLTNSRILTYMLSLKKVKYTI